MGAYINPRDMRKEEWLEKNAVRVVNLCWAEVKPETLPVCLVDNGPFTAAGIAYSEEEFVSFHRYDGRPKCWYIAPIDKLHTVSPELVKYLKGTSYE